MLIKPKDESCIVKFGELPGVYVSNACAIVWAADLRKLLEYDAPQARKEAVMELVELLESVK